MAKLRLYCCLIFLICCFRGYGQYQLKVIPVDKDSLFLSKTIPLHATFKDKSTCLAYIDGIPALLRAKGYINASLDSIYADSLHAFVALYAGETFKWSRIKTKSADATVLDATGWNEKNYSGKPLNYPQLQNSQRLLLNYMENNGYPFAKISLDSIAIRNNELIGVLKIDRGPLYKIDSIRIYGNAKISNDFLQHYLNLPNGSIYKKEKLQTISKRLLELPYVQEQQPWKLVLLGTGSVLDLYLKPKKSSQIDALIGFLPSNSNGTTTSAKLLVTGQATINLKNSLGNGESLSLNWQQVQPKSPKLDLSFTQPYLFKSPFGIQTSFSLYKRDSSYININFLVGAQYFASATQTSTVFIQITSSNLLNLDTTQVIASHKLPDSLADVSSVSIGLNYEFNNTNYRFNPRRGNEFQFQGSIGTKKIK
ncbi:MAG TPA: POTRA domain-containing protein, partial [Puia sp.]|nr:POTRA domain-containing protein [Puia sp.]